MKIGMWKMADSRRPLLIQVIALFRLKRLLEITWTLRRHMMHDKWQFCHDVGGDSSPVFTQYWQGHRKKLILSHAGKNISLRAMMRVTGMQTSHSHWSRLQMWKHFLAYFIQYRPRLFLDHLKKITWIRDYSKTNFIVCIKYLAFV